MRRHCTGARVPKRTDGENVNTMADLAVGVIDELRNIRRFLLQPTTHPDWSSLVRDMPADLRALLDAVDLADQVRLQASERCYEAEGRLRQIEAETERAEQQDAEADALNQLRERSDHASTELAAAQEAVDATVRAWREAGRALARGENFSRMAAYEQEKKEAWLLAHREVLRRRRDDLDAAIGGYRHRLDGLPDRLGLRHPDRIKANSASLVLLRLADVVQRDPQMDLLNLDLEQLQLDVAHELAALTLDNLGKEQDREAAKPMRAADRLFAVAAALIREGRYDATQAEVAKLAKCSSRELRRGRGKAAWQNYIEAGARPPNLERPKVAQSRHQRLVAEKVREERRSRDE